MSSLEEGGPNHTSDSFQDFINDFLDYVLPKYECDWTPQHPDERTSKKIFEEWFGNVVILFRTRNPDSYKKKFALIESLNSTGKGKRYVVNWIESIFKGKIPLMEVIAYCALLLDIGLICYELEDLDLLFSLQEYTLDVFDLHIQPYFTIIGGWYALYRVAEQYYMYIMSKPLNNSGVSVAKNDIYPLEPADTHKL